MRRAIQDYPQVSLKLQDLDGKIDFAALFRRSAPVEVEIGTGKAAFLLNQAKNYPEINFLGIEWASRYYRYAVDRIGRWNLANVRIIRTDAAVFLTEFIPDESVDCFHIYFPDPWPKNRHHKRRLFNETNLNQMIRCLKREGIIQVATDHAEYFEQIQKLIEGRGDLQKIAFQPAAGAQQGELVGSNFERKYLKDSKNVHTLAVRKIGTG
jgi:tRNA (guanine-N7-)-methyltransferase